MGAKFKNILIALLLLSQAVKGQQDLNFQYVDSVTYSYYKSGNWTDLIELGNRAVDGGIDYKYLRQRLGYACYLSGDLVRAARNFDKALEYDSYDPFTLVYLYYTNMYLLKPEKSGYFASRLSEVNKKVYQIKSSRLVENIDFELSVKVPSTTLRSDPKYYRLGAGSRPWERLGIYQSISSFNQYITIRYPTQYNQFNNRQFEYYGIARYALSAKWSVKAAYHFLYSDYSSLITYTNLGYTGLSLDYNILSIKAYGTVLSNSTITAKQAGIRIGLRIPGNANISVTSGVALLNQQGNNGMIYSENFGIKLNEKIWMEGDITWGYMNYYNDFDAMYVYNSIDPMTFRTGLTTYFMAQKKITLWINLGTESKEYYETDLYNYNQFSFLGGVRWRL